MKITNVTPLFNPVNNGFMYLCQADDGSVWVRSVAGNWAQIKTSVPMDTDTVAADFDAFQKKGLSISENDVKVDNAAQVVIDPVKDIAPAPIAPDEEPLPDPQPEAEVPPADPIVLEPPPPSDAPATSTPPVM